MKIDKRKTQTSNESPKRKQAAKPRDKFVGGKPNLLPDDYQEVIHNLQVHQTELAAQNEELRRMQRKLEESHNRYVDLYDHAPVGYFTLDRKGRILAVNRVGSRQLGGEAEALLDRPFPSFMCQDDSDLFYLHLKKVFTVPFKQTCSLTLIQENGTLFYAQLNSVLSSIGPGKKSIFQTTVTDISERRVLEEALQISETRYRSLFEAAMEGILILDAETSEITDVNPFLTEMLGYSPEEVLGKRLWDIGCLKDTDASKNVFSELQRNGYVRYDNLPLATKSGRQIAVEFISSIYLVNNTRVIQCSIRDVTERNLLEMSSPFASDGMEQKRGACRSEPNKLTELYEQAIKENKQTIKENKQTEESLLQALAEIKVLKERLVIRNIYVHQVIEKREKFDQIIGQSDGLKYVLYRAEQVAPTDATVLILGETGTGKELIADAIHNLSSRQDRPLITVNCAALPASLLESELFGREKGAFTGADTRQVGRFEIADGSTLCLDEIGELPLDMQAKLLRVIQHGQFERLGSSKTIKVDVRVMATTNRNLEDEIAGGRFRKDLYYRLNVFPITVPPLRKRVEDIPLMVQAFVQRYAREMGKQITSIPKKTMQALQDYQWPGNVRELESIIERAVILCPGPDFQLADNLNTSPPPDSFTGGTVKEMECKLILNTLVEKEWRIEGKDGAAKVLGLHPSTLRARMHKLGIVRGDVSSQFN
jgi:PAS domain S-box-containing protein